MGVIKELVLLPVAPLRFTIWIAGKVAEEVEREHFSPQARIRQLQEIDEKRRRGEVTEEEAAEAEAKIVEAQTAEPPNGGQEAGQSG